MTGEHAPRMSTEDYAGFLGRAVLACRSADVDRLRTEVLQRWSGDPWALELDRALALYQERLAAPENPLRVQSSRVTNGSDQRTEEPAA